MRRPEAMLFLSSRRRQIHSQFLKVVVGLSPRPRHGVACVAGRAGTAVEVACRLRPAGSGVLESRRTAPGARHCPACDPCAAIHCQLAYSPCTLQWRSAADENMVVDPSMPPAAQGRVQLAQGRAWPDRGDDHQRYPRRAADQRYPPVLGRTI